MNALGPKLFLVPSAPLNYGFRCEQSPYGVGTVLYTVWLNLQWLLTGVYGCDCMHASSAACRRLAYRFKRNVSLRHDWIYGYWTISIVTRFESSRHLGMCNVYGEMVVQFKTGIVMSALVLTETSYPTMVDWHEGKYTGTVKYTCRRGGFGARKYLLGAEAVPFAVGMLKYVRDDDKLVFSSQLAADQIPLSISTNLLKLVANVPLRALSAALSVSNLKIVCKLHEIKFDRHRSSQSLQQDLADHVCGTKSCASLVTVLDVQRVDLDVVANRKIERRRVTRPAERARKKEAAKRSNISHALATKNKLTRDKRAEKKKVIVEAPPIFPPVPPTKVLRHEIITGMCNDVDPVQIEESGCAVCGQLTLNTELTPIKDLELNWELLKRPGVTRKERFSDDDHIEELDGPIFADNCRHVCVDCEARLRSNTLPLFSLANELWIGEINTFAIARLVVCGKNVDSQGQTQ